MSAATLNRVLSSTYILRRKMVSSLENLVRTIYAELLVRYCMRQVGNTDWIEKCLAHEQRGVRAIYNKAEYREQRTAMLQDWADMIDEWTTKQRQ